MAKSAEAEASPWDSDGSLSWEDFFGKPTELVPTLLGMYDALVGRSEDAVDADAGGQTSERHAAAATPTKCAKPAAARPRAPTTSPASACPPPGGGGGGRGGGGGGVDLCLEETPLGVPRPLSVTSIASSSSSSSGTSSCSGGLPLPGRRLGLAPKSSPYLASIESLDDTDDEDGLGKGVTNSVSSQGSGSGDSGVCSPCSPCSHLQLQLQPPLTSPSSQGCHRHPHPHLSFMDRVVMEILETEGVYVRDLQQIITGYLAVWRGRPEGRADGPLGPAQLDALFGNIQDVYRFNSNFLRQLEQCDLDPVQVARCFVRNNAGFSVYTEYCTNYPRTVSVLTELMRREAAVRLFRERQSALQHTLPLGAYLLKPVQRILKYHLLLQNIVKHSSCERQGRDGYGDIVDALSTMTAIAHHINDMKRRHEHAVRVQEIQSLLYGWEGEDLTTFGELCAEGTFRVAGAKALRHVFLFDKMLLITKKKEESTLGYKAHIMCSNLMLIESVPGEPLSFHVIPFDNPRMQYTLLARTLEQKREWSLQLKRVILENYHAVIPSHARQLVMELGQKSASDVMMADKVTPRRQHSAPEYLERRKQERERRKSETGLRSRLRRNRKSDADTIAESATRRGRRGSSSSREGEREDSILSLADRTRDRIASWRRKSEPVGYSGAGNGSAKRHVSIDLHIQGPMSRPRAEADVNADPEAEAGTAPTASASAATSTTTATTTTSAAATGAAAAEEARDEGRRTPTLVPSTTQDPVEEAPPPSTPTSTPTTPVLAKVLPQAETIEQIVGQLLMQNREFQRILKKQQRQLSLRQRITAQGGAPCAKGETTDEEAEEEEEEAAEEEAIYETLSALATVHRHHRHHHRRYSHSHSVECSNDEEDYVTLVCRDDDGGDEEDEEQSRRLEDRVREIVVQAEAEEAPTAPPRPRARLKREQAVADVGPPVTWGVTRQDSLQSLWDRLRRSQRLGGNKQAASAAGVRRAASFSSQQSNSHFYVDTPAASTAVPGMAALCQPITPAVWLKQQAPHLSLSSNHKAGSLPRSFQVGPEGEALPGRSKETLRARVLRSGRSCPDRPFTIASDKPSHGPHGPHAGHGMGLSMEDMDMERYHRFGGGDTTEDDSMTEYTATPNASLHELNVHPEYRIYRPSLPLGSLRHALSRLVSGLRTPSTPSSTSPSTPSADTTSQLDWEQRGAAGGGLREWALQRERRRVAAVVVKQYSKTLRRRIRGLMGDEPPPPPPPQEPCCSPTSPTAPTTTPTYKQGSSGLGARIASRIASSESEYANPRLLFQHIRPSKKAAALLGVRPDSVLSVASATSAASSGRTVSTSTSSSDGDKTSGFGGSVDTAPRRPLAVVPDSEVGGSASSEEAAESDCSADSFYERSFEAMECVLESTDVFRDSAVFSDHDEESPGDSDDSLAPPSYPPPPPPQQQAGRCATAPTTSTTTTLPAKPSPTVMTTFVLPDTQPAARTKVPPPVPTKPKRKPSFTGGDLPCIPMTALVSRLSEACSSPAPAPAPLAVPDLDEQGDSISQHSVASTVIEAGTCSGPPCPTSKGWVKHVIGRLQGEGLTG